jgi:hypothetical protein
MFQGFDPATRDQVFARRNRRSLLIAAASYLVLFGSWIALDKSKEKAVEVRFEPEVKDFAIEEEPEPEPEDEPPPPPEVKPQPQVQKPKPKPKPLVPKEIPQGPPPEQDKPAEDKAYGSGQNPGQGTSKPKTEVKKPEVKKPEVKKPEPPKPAAEPIDPTKPVDRPEKASVPQPDAGNKPPDYPKELRDAGVEGEVVVKLRISSAPATPRPARTRRSRPTRRSRAPSSPRSRPGSTPRRSSTASRSRCGSSSTSPSSSPPAETSEAPHHGTVTARNLA